jgi:hypothetical protein
MITHEACGASTRLAASTRGTILHAAAVASTSTMK